LKRNPPAGETIKKGRKRSPFPTVSKGETVLNDLIKKGPTRQWKARRRERKTQTSDERKKKN